MLLIIQRIKASLIYIKKNDIKLVKEVTLPRGNYKIWHPYIRQNEKVLTNILNIRNIDNNELIIIALNALDQPKVKKIDNTKLIRWIDERTFITSNDFEIWLHDLDNNKPLLITRISKSINSILWHPSKKFIIYSTENTIDIIDFSKKQHNLYQVFKADRITSPFLNKKGDTLYFSAELGNLSGLYKLFIQ
jgi:tricorn protease-like protein